MGVVRTKAFKSGNSVAVRLPKELGIEVGAPVSIERDGNNVIIRPAVDPAEEKRALDELLAQLRAIGPVGEIGKREPIDIPERRGL